MNKSIKRLDRLKLQECQMFLLKTERIAEDAKIIIQELLSRRYIREKDLMKLGGALNAITALGNYRIRSVARELEEAFL